MLFHNILSPSIYSNNLSLSLPLKKRKKILKPNKKLGGAKVNQKVMYVEIQLRDAKP